MSAKYKSPSFLLPNELNTSANSANDTGINSLYSMNFDGAGGTGIAVNGSLTTLGISDTFSFSLWVNVSNYVQYRHILSNSNFYSGFALYMQNNRWRFHVNNYNTNYIEDTTDIVENQWYHIAVTWNNTTGAKMYVNNGTPITGLAGLTLGNLSTNIEIGGTSNVSQYTPYGKIDEVAIFNKSLTSENITSLYNSGSPASAATVLNLGAVAYYPLGEQAQMQGYLGNEASSEWQFPNGVLQDYVMDFDGVNDFIDLGNLQPSTTSLSISAWAYKTDTSNASIIGRGASVDYGIFVYSGSLQFGINAGGWTTISTTLPVNQWFHVLATWDGTTMKLYVNGGTPVTASKTGTITYTSNNTTIGKNSTLSGFEWDGKISNVAIWNSDQSTNIANIYNNGSPQTTYTVTPQNWWKLNADSVYTPSAPNYTTALDFVASESDYIDAGSSIGVIGTGVRTFSVWLKTSSNAIQTILGTRNVNTDGWVIQWNQPGILFYNPLGGTNQGILSTTGNAANLTDGNWHHLVIVRAGTGNNKIYVDGVSQTLNTAFGDENLTDPQSSKNLLIGAGYTTGGALFRYFDGELSNTAIFNSALTESQVSTLFNFGTPETNISFSPQAWWKLDDQTAITDSSGNGNTGTNNGATDISSGVAVVPSWKIPSALTIPTINYTTALDFDGNTNYVTAGTTSYLNNVTEMSLSIWFNLDTAAQDKGLISDFTYPATGHFTLLTKGVIGNNYSLRLYMNNGGPESSIQISNQPFTAGQWHNLVMTYANSTINFYIDGQPAASSAYSGATPSSFANSTTTLDIGKYSTLEWDGLISNAQIWTTELSSSDALSIYNNGQPSTTAFGSPVSWWKLDSTTITDSVGSNNGTNNGATPVTSDVYSGNIPVNGVSTTLPSTALQQSDLQFDSPYSNYSLYFDGTGDYIDCTDISYFSGADRFTLSTWFKVDSSDDGVNNRDIISKGSTTAGTTSFFIRKGKNTNLNKISLSFNEGTINVPGTTQLQNNVWYHLTVVYKGYESNNADRAKIYINGVDDTGSYTNTVPTTLVSSTQPLRIGRWASGTDFYGNIDETAIWQSVLTDAQILQVYNNGRPSDITSLSPNYWWRLGENAYFDNNSFIVPNSITGAPNGTGSGTITTMISADAPGTYANGIGTNLAILDRVGDAPLSTSNSQSYNMIPSDISPYVPQYVGKQIANNFSMTFSGVLDYISLGNPNILQITGAISLSFWFNSTASTFGFITKSDNGSYFSSNASKVYEIGVLSNTLYWQIGDGTNVSNLPLAFSSYLDGNWHHVVATWDGSTNASSQMLFVDGLQVGSHQATISAIQNKSNNVIISSQSASYDYVGKLDEVAIFDKALTPDQVKFDLYKPTAEGTNQTADIANNPNLPNPVAWYRMGD